MTEVKPFLKCVDFWPGQIPPDKLDAYRQLIDEGQIRNHSVVHNKVTGATVVEYYAIAPHEWILEKLGRFAAGFREETPGEQIRMNV